jgi:hypothetical protein
MTVTDESATICKQQKVFRPHHAGARASDLQAEQACSAARP